MRITYILDPTQTTDQKAFSGIVDLVGDITATPQEINDSPLFAAAENEIVLLLPDAKLRDPPEAGKGRTYPQRTEVVEALEWLTGYYFLTVGGKTATQQNAADRDIKSTRTEIENVQETKEYIKSHKEIINSANTLMARAAFMKSRADLILSRLGVKLPDTDTPDSDPDGLATPTVSLTDAIPF